MFDLSHWTLLSVPHFPHLQHDCLVVRPDHKIVVRQEAWGSQLLKKYELPFLTHLSVSLPFPVSFRQVAYPHLPGILSLAVWLKGVCVGGNFLL